MQNDLTVMPTVACISDVGRVRQRNEDACWVPAPARPAEELARRGALCLAADGMGGHQAGDLASRTAVQVISQAYYQDPDPDVAASLERAIQAGHDAIRQMACEPGHEGMGATLVAAGVRGTELVVAHAGDSRAYLLRRGILQRLTEDHTWVAEEVNKGALTVAEAKAHPYRHVITRSLGDKSTVEVEVSRHPFLPEDTLLLCTDGLWELVPEREIGRVLRGRDAEPAARDLIKRARAYGGTDNITAVVVGPPHPSRALPALLRPISERRYAVSLAMLLGLALVSFLIGWLLVGWTIWPVEWERGNAAPAELLPAYQAHHVNVLARAWDADRTLDVKAMLGGDWPAGALESAFQAAYERAEKAQDAAQKQRLEALAAKVGVQAK